MNIEFKSENVLYKLLVSSITEIFIKYIIYIITVYTDVCIVQYNNNICKTYKS